MARKHYDRVDTFERDGVTHTLFMNKTGDKMPQPARIRIMHMYFDETGGTRSWEPVFIYDRTFNDWTYAYSVYDAILKRNAEGNQTNSK